MPTSQQIKSALAPAQLAANYFTHPLFIQNDKGVRQLLASGIILRFERAYYLITASHALKQAVSHGHSLEIAGHSSYLNVAGRYVTSEALKGSDHFDIAFIELTSDFIIKNKLAYLCSEQCEQWESLNSVALAFIHGFPISRNRKPNAFNGGGPLRISGFGYAGKLLDKEVLFKQFNKDITMHSCLSYGNNPDKNKPLKPRGLSGGGLWLMPDWDKPNEIWLDSIVIEYHDSKRVVFGTKLSRVLHFIKDKI
ncbi:hypothetical protein [Aliidiomarina soli]|uniref:Peptidase S1 domain-containing protein n=1 Tax=Aliidiomarina soli TaxID=1928574 RepID=A0A432WI10_9GAMM|nr:hypothetical protein [Aliidiomarina soli]RUO33319.1 hypothetical protein CWE14_08875 [Aliidiomarina soli]